MILTVQLLVLLKTGMSLLQYYAAWQTHIYAYQLTIHLYAILQNSALNFLSKIFNVVLFNSICMPVNWEAKVIFCPHLANSQRSLIII